jgi:hypothetical protein
MYGTCLISDTKENLFAVGAVHVCHCGIGTADGILGWVHSSLDAEYLAKMHEDWQVKEEDGTQNRPSLHCCGRGLAIAFFPRWTKLLDRIKGILPTQVWVVGWILVNY